MDSGSRVYVAGHTGLVGSAVVRNLEREGYSHIVTRTHQELDLTRQTDVESFFQTERPEYVILAAAMVGGINANYMYAADFIRENGRIQTNVIDCCHRFEVTKLCFMGSSCIYPKLAAQPIAESSLMSGPLEPTNSAYAIAKIAGVEMCQSYHRQYGMSAICVMPANLYGQNDNFDLETSHVLPAIIRKICDAKDGGEASVRLWGTGKPLREFMHVDDVARAIVFLMNEYDSSEIINVGTGDEISISALAELIRDVVGYDGRIEFDPSMSDGTPRKLLDVSKITALGWRPEISLHDGIRNTIAWFMENRQCQTSP